MNDGRARVRRSPRKRYDPQFDVESSVHHIVGLTAWGAIAYDSRTPLVFIGDNMTALRYIHEVVKYLETLENPIFQEDNLDRRMYWDLGNYKKYG